MAEKHYTVYFSININFVYSRSCLDVYKRQVLHNADRLTIDTVEEGEISILQSEITKMTLRILSLIHI